MELTNNYGTISTYNQDKGFGFLVHGETQRFFHITDWCAAELPIRGMVVAFDLARPRNPRYPDQAVNIHIVAEQAVNVAKVGA